MKNNIISSTMGKQESVPIVFQPWMELRSAIVLQAAKDYIEILRSLWKKGLTIQDRFTLIKEKTELERFFYSRWYDCLCDVPPDQLISGCIERAKELETEAIEKKNQKRIKKLLKYAL